MASDENSTAPGNAASDSLPSFRPAYGAPEEIIYDNVPRTLGLSTSKWDAVKIRALKELANLPWVKLSARVLLITTFNSIEQIQKAMDVAEEMMKRPKDADDPISDETRLAAGAVMAKCSEALGKATDRAMTLAEKGVDRKEEQRPRLNLPPQVNVQVNSYQQPAGTAQAPEPKAGLGSLLPATNGQITKAGE